MNMINIAYDEKQAIKIAVDAILKLKYNNEIKHTNERKKFLFWKRIDNHR